MEYDYIVVGAGSAGCVVASRLSEDPSCRVLLVEAGRSSRDLRIRTPGMVATLWRTKFDWGFRTEPQRHMHDRRGYWPRGKVVGGSNALNYLIYMRGHRADYDGWRDAGNDGWGYDDLLPLFKRSEDYAGGADEHHGVGGPLRVEDVREAKICQLLAEAAAEACEAPLVDDLNTAEREGFGPFQLTVRNGRRCSSATAFLVPALRRPNLSLAAGALVESLVFEGNRATGVRYRGRRGATTARAAREVILCAGAIGSPHLLLLSGIGPAAELEGHGITVRRDLPGVGKNLQDHLLAPIGYEISGDVAGSVDPLHLAAWLARYLITHRGPLSSTGAEAGGFIRTTTSAAVPDLQFHFLGTAPPPAPLDEINYDPKGRGCSLLPTLLYPQSRGEIRLASSAPDAVPIIDPRYFEADVDLETLFRGARIAHEIVTRPPARQWIGKPLTPGSDPGIRDDELRDYLRGWASTIFHPAGTCKMGSDSMAVVDAQLRVRGVDGLRVADASIMPTIVGGNTNAPTIMIGEKLASMLRGEGARDQKTVSV